MGLTSMLRQAVAVQAGEIGRQVRGALMALVLMLIAGLLLVTGLVFLMLGGYQSLAEHLPNWQAGGVVALSTLFVCLILLFIAGRQGGKASKPSASAPPAPAAARRPPAAQDQEAAELGAAAGEMFREYRPSGMELGLAALVAGLVASRASRRGRD